MNDREKTERLVAALGTRIGLETLALDPETNSTVLVFDGDVIVTLEYDAPAARLVFSSYLGELPRAGAEPALRELMAANLYWHRTRGATLCLDEGMGGIILAYAHPIGDLDADRIEAVLENVVNEAERWSKRLAEISATGVPSDVRPDPGDITVQL